MNRHTLPVLVAVIVGCAVMASPAYAQFETRNKDVQVFGMLSIPHRNPGSATAFGDFGVGYYLNRKSRVGVDFTGNGGGGTGAFGVLAGYDHFIATKSPKLFPFVGGQLGASLQFAGGTTKSSFQSQAEFGIDYYLAKKTALDTRYIFAYAPQVAGTAADKTSSQIVMGIRIVF